MKRNTKILLYMRRKKIRWDEADQAEDVVDSQRVLLDFWPDLGKCTELYCRFSPAMKQYCAKSQQQMALECTPRFTRSIDKYCTTENLKLQVIAALAKLLHGIPGGGLNNAPIKEKTDLWHLRISYFWRVFYRKDNETIQLLEFCPHKKLAYLRRL